MKFMFGFVLGAFVASLPWVRGTIYTFWGKLLDARKRGGF